MKQILLLILILILIGSSEILAQTSNNVVLKGKLFLFDTLKTGKNRVAEKGIIDIYYKKDTPIVKRSSYYYFDTLRVARHYTDRKGQFNIELPNNKHYLIRLHDPSSDIIDLDIVTDKKIIDLGEITLKDMTTIKGKIFSYPEYLKECSSIDEYASIIVCQADNNVRDDIVGNLSSLSDGSFEFKIRRGEYTILIIGGGMTNRIVTVKSDNIDLGEIKLGALVSGFTIAKESNQQKRLRFIKGEVTVNNNTTNLSNNHKKSISIYKGNCNEEKIFNRLAKPIFVDSTKVDGRFKFAVDKGRYIILFKNNNGDRIIRKVKLRKESIDIGQIDMR